jgi:hypothetical protein
MRRVLIASAVLLASGGAALAQPVVEVSLAPAVQARSQDLGQDALDAQRVSLRQQVMQALARQDAPVRSVRLVIQDIQPNRPTSAELGASASLSATSFGLGGAAITGEVVAADGVDLPVRYRYFPPNLFQETNFDTQEAFATVAHGIAKGAPPDQQGAWPPPHRPSAPTGTLIQR